METRFRRSFDRDLRKIRDTKLLERIRQSIQEIESAEGVSQVTGIRKMRGTTSHYRIRVGNYRVVFEVQAATADFVRVRPRSEVYRLGVPASAADAEASANAPLHRKEDATTSEARD